MLKDPWVQIFAFLALMSAGLSAHAQFSAAPRPAAEPPAPPKAVANAEPPAVGPGAASRAAAAPPEASGLVQAPGSAYAPMLTPMLTPVDQSLPKGVVARLLKPRAAGMWVVDAAGADDADAKTLSDVLASARDGDVVFIRPGHYTEKITIAGSVTLRGTGGDSSAVTIDSDAPLTVAVGRGDVRIEHLTLANVGSSRTTVLAVSGGRLTLVDTSILGVDGQGLRVSGGSVDGEDVRLRGRIALIADAAGRVSLTRANIEGREVGAVVTGDNAAGEFIKTAFRNASRQLMVQNSGRANVNGCTFGFDPGAPRDGAIVAVGGAKVLITNTRIDLGHLARMGVAAREASITASRTTIVNSAGDAAEAGPGSVLTLTDSALEDNASCALMATGAKIALKRTSLRRSLCGIGFLRDVTARIDGSRFEGNRLAPLVATIGDERTLSLSGAGNFGAQMTLAGLHLVPRAAPSASPAPPPPSAPSRSGLGAPPGSAAATAPSIPAGQTMDPESKPVLLR